MSALPIVVFALGVLQILGQGADPSVNNCIREVENLLTELETCFRLDYMLGVRVIFHPDAVLHHHATYYRGIEQIEGWFRMITRERGRFAQFQRGVMTTNPQDTKVVTGVGWSKLNNEIFEYTLVGVRDEKFHYWIKELTYMYYGNYYGPFRPTKRYG